MRKKPGPSAQSPGHIAILDNGRDSHELMLAAMRFANSQSVDELGKLEAGLTDKDFLGRLDNAEDPPGSFAGLRLAGVLGVLMDNDQQYARNILVRLIDDAVFQAKLLRMQLLAHILAGVRPAPEPVIDYWRKLSGPESPLTFDVVAALCANQSDGAMTLLEALFADVEQDDRQKLAWMRQLILPRRDDLAILLTSERLLKESLPENLHLALVEVLFDYLPAQWYLGSVVPQPPDRSEIRRESEEVLRRIAEHALENLPLSDRQRESVRNPGL